MAETAVTLLQDQLKEILKWYEGIIYVASTEINLLYEDMSLLKAFLHDAAKSRKQTLMFRNIERRIRDMVYDIQDTIETSLNNVIVAKAKMTMSSFYRGLHFLHELKSIRKDKVLPIVHEAVQMFSMMPIGDGSQGMEDPPTKHKQGYAIRRDKIVGFEDEENTITGYLMQETKRLDVISIIGICGQGKTTLTCKVFESQNIEYQFPIRIWVHISQVFNSRDVFLNILRRFISSQGISYLDTYELTQTVRACLEREKFLLVFDDVWSVDVWNEIKDVLPLGNGSSKVLITSEAMDVGIHSTVYTKPHKLRSLTEDESFMLLQCEVFNNFEDCPDELRGIVRDIAQQCDGLPLTIVVIGGVLINTFIKTRKTFGIMHEWKMVSENVSNILQNNPEWRIIDNAVALSFERLPVELRDCFVYLGVFPEDYQIPVKMLCSLWIAEGFILPSDGKSLEESAENNLNDLICRSLLKVEKTDQMGKVKTCRVHDIIRAFCITKSKEDNLFQEIKISSSTGELEPPDSEVQKYHRLCFQSDLSKFFSQKPRGPRVRSFMCFNDQPFNLDARYISCIPDSFPKLRILESKSIKFHQFPAKIIKLIHLRYLTLCIHTLVFLPEGISQLWNLQTLIVETKSRSITMKANKWKMTGLKHLNTNAPLVLDTSKWEGEAARNLLTLDKLSPKSCTEDLTKMAKNLKTLGISGKLENMLETRVLEKLHHLEKLKLVNSLTDEPTSDDKPIRLPQWNCFPPHLKRLTLMNTFLDWRDMSMLANIRSLEALKLKDNAFVGLSWNVSADNFPNLQLLLIVNSDLIVWEATIDSFPILKFLVVKNCGNLVRIPECVGTCLEKLEIYHLRKSAVESARRIEKAQRDKPEGKFAVPFVLTISPRD